MAEMHSFPIKRDPAVPVPKVPRFWSEMQELDAPAAHALIGVTKNILSGSTMLLEYIDNNREEAHQAGVETIGIELSAIIEGGKIEAVQEGLEDSARRGEAPQISLDGFSKLRRAERLLSDAEASLSRFTGGRSPGDAVKRETPANPRTTDLGCTHCHASHHHPSLGVADLSTSMFVLSIVGVGVVLTLVILACKKS